jgi:hypothetical protein
MFSLAGNVVSESNITLVDLNATGNLGAKIPTVSTVFVCQCCYVTAVQGLEMQ